MDSGIYKLSFGYDNMVYIGQSLNVHNRFQEHLIDMERNKAAQNMQAAYDLYGAPTMEILQIAHPDYLNRLESLFIHNYIDSGNYVVLNKTIPPVQSRNDQEILTKDLMENLKHSIPSVLRENEILKKNIQRLQSIAYDNNKGQESAIYWKNQHHYLENELAAYKKRGFFKRLFNIDP